MRMGWLVCLVFNLTLSATEAPRSFPLWDGRETTAEYAARVRLPATKSLDLGGGVALELVLIPAGQFIMGSEAPKKPTVTGEESIWFIGLGALCTIILLQWMVNHFRETRKLSFSLRWLVLLTISIGACMGGFARIWFTRTQATQYAIELAAFNALPANEKPAHLVTLTQPFYMGKYTVTQAQYAAVMGTNPSWFKGANLPVETVSWDDATAFCSKLNATLHDKTLAVRLPTEAQWEFACRAGTRTRFYSGDADSDLDAVGWYGSNSGNTTHPVGQKKPNAFGLNDMHGNVWQWCQDFYTENYATAPIIDPLNNKGAARVLRGGSWEFNPNCCRSAYRYGNFPFSLEEYIGFRVIASPPPPF